ncbi:MAG: hypothetical protein EOP04_19810 [Proteobacteria bacterium]|nr:MAG: hypothetical protein EOP04_19810 [Pseudomonadota bacterium]
MRLPISLQMKRVTFEELLGQLHEATKLNFSLGSGLPQSKLFTAKVKDMPLGEFMNALSRMYGVTWFKDKDSIYRMDGSKRGDLYLKLLQMGDPERYRSRYMFYERADREWQNTAVVAILLENIASFALAEKEGVAYSKLPQALQKQLRYVLEEPSIETNCKMLFYVNSLIQDNLAGNQLFLRFGNPKSTPYQTPFYRMSPEENLDLLRFDVIDGEGKIHIPVFDDFAVHVSKNRPIQVRPPSRRR